jgi:hypothetical protein
MRRFFLHIKPATGRRVVAPTDYLTEINRQSATRRETRRLKHDSP